MKRLELQESTWNQVVLAWHGNIWRGQTGEGGDGDM